MKTDKPDLDELVIMDTDMSVADFLSRVPLKPEDRDDDETEGAGDTICLPCRLYVRVTDYAELAQFVAERHVIPLSWVGDEYEGLGFAEIELGYGALIARDIDDEDHPITLNGGPVL